MNKPTWLLYGGKGWIGQHLIKYCSSVTENIVCSSLRVTDAEEIKSEIHTVQPARVICLLGRTSDPNHKPVEEKEKIINTSKQTIDWLEGHLHENLLDNLMGPMILERICAEANIHFTYFGTGCLFASTTQDPVIETQQPSFFGSSYAIVKGCMDRWMNTIAKSHSLNVRIKMPISDDLQDPKNFMYRFLAYTKTQIHSATNSFTVLHDCLPVLVQMIRDKRVGTINLVNPEPLSHDAILTLYKTIVQPELTWKTVTKEKMETKLIAKRTACILDTKIMEALHVPKLSLSLKKMFTSWSTKQA